MILPQLASSPAIAVFTKRELIIEKAIFFACIFVLQFKTFNLINLLMPSPSFSCTPRYEPHDLIHGERIYIQGTRRSTHASRSPPFSGTSRVTEPSARVPPLISRLEYTALSWSSSARTRPTVSSSSEMSPASETSGHRSLLLEPQPLSTRIRGRRARCKGPGRYRSWRTPSRPRTQRHATAEGQAGAVVPGRIPPWACPWSPRGSEVIL